MAKSLVTDAGTLYIPGAYAKYTVQSANAGLATTGVLMLVGEADAGPDWSLESDLEDNSFGPDQLTAVIAKYKSGPIVDAFRAATSPANDPDIVGSFSRAILVKTNVSGKAQGILSKIGGGTYSVLADKSYGKLGNNIQFQTTSAQAEVVPTTGSFTYIPATGTVAYALRANGGAALTAGTLSANTSPTAFVAAWDGLAGVSATGGADRVILTVAGTLLLDANPVSNPGAYNIKLTRSVAWAVTPTVGDTLIIPSGSVVDGGGSDENVGAYVIISATSTEIVATKLSDAGKTGGVPGTITTPIDVSPAVSAAAVTDAQAFSPVTVSLEAGVVVDGRGKSLEVGEVSSGTDLLSRTAFNLGTAVGVSWISKSSAAKLLTSSAEYKVTLAASRLTDGASESFTTGGEIALKLGYTGTTATVTVTDTALTTSVTGGSGSNLSILLKDFKSIQELANYINAQSGYTCSVGTASLGLQPSTALDNVTAQGMATQFGEKTARLKIDGFRFFRAINDNSLLVQLGIPAEQAASGLPAAMASATFMTGGTKGATTDALIVAAIDALAKVRGNFVVPLFSRDADLDVADELTESGSTYTIAAVHAATKSHVLAMSTYKRRRNRQAFLSIAGDFADQKDIAANIASFRCSMAFQDFKQLGGDGSVTQFLPWMGSTLAAAMQAAGFYRNIEFKGINTSGVLHREADFSDKDDSQMEDALQSGLLPAKRALTGGFIFVSDQSTYGKDSNFVFNSIQAVYAADTVALTTAQRMEGAFVGQSVADISAPVALSFLEGIMADMLRLKLIAPSDDAKKGFRNAKIQISGNSMLVSLEIKLATAIDFITIDFLVSPVQQTAG